MVLLSCALKAGTKSTGTASSSVVGTFHKELGKGFSGSSFADWFKTFIK